MAEKYRELKKEFVDALSSAPTSYKSIATVINSKVPTTDYAWLADMPGMKEWIGDRDLKTLSAYKYTITKKNWEASIKVDRDVIQYDNFGIVMPKVRRMAEAVVEHYDSQVFGLLEKGVSEICYDGKPFFSDTHQIGGVNFSNKGALALTRENLLKTKAEMARLVKDNANPLGIRPNLLVVPPELEATALEILVPTTLANGATNITHNMAGLLVCPYLTNNKNWYLMDTRGTLKPMILQVNKEVEFVAQDKPDSEANFMRREIRYGVDTEDNTGFGMWQLAYANIVA